MSANLAVVAVQIQDHLSIKHFLVKEAQFD